MYMNFQYNYNCISYVYPLGILCCYGIFQIIMIRLQRVTFTALHNYLGLSSELISSVSTVTQVWLNQIKDWTLCVGPWFCIKLYVSLD